MKNTKHRHSSPKNQYYMFGTHTVMSAIRNPKRNIIKILTNKHNSENILHELKKHGRTCPVDIVDNNVISEKVERGATHQGVIALVKQKMLSDFNYLQLSPTKDRIVILDQITDPQNIGAIIRSAAAFGINKLILPKNNTPEENGSIAKSACGCLEFIDILQTANLKQTIDKLKKLGFWTIGLEKKATDNLNQAQSVEKLAIIIGSEGKGMRKLTSENCDFFLSIPISKQVESLNAASAASIAFYLLR